jgi:penicillin-insensitive murein endopeptidase
MIKLILILLFLPSLAYSATSESICYGTTSNGKLEGGVELPKSGSNFQSYSSIGNLMGRTFVHSKVLSVILKSYGKLETSYPEKFFMYGERGQERGQV